MSFFTISGNKLAMTVLAAGALAVGGTGVAAMAESAPDSPPVVAATESPSPTPTETETASPTPTETESPDPTPTETETEAPEPTPTETATDTPEPSPTETDDLEPAPTSTAAGPDATGPAAFGLCNAFTNGGLSPNSTAFAALAEAAGGESGIGAYCDTVAAPEEGDEDAGLPTDDATDDQVEQGQAGQQQVQEQRQGAAASNGAAGHQSGNGAKHANGGQR